MAGDAAVTLELHVALELFLADRAGVAAEIAIEARRRNERPRECRDRIDDILARDAVGIDRAEFRCELAVSIQLADDLGPGGIKNLGVLDQAVEKFFE